MATQQMKRAADDKKEEIIEAFYKLRLRTKPPTTLRVLPTEPEPDYIDTCEGCGGHVFSQFGYGLMRRNVCSYCWNVLEGD